MVGGTGDGGEEVGCCLTVETIPALINKELSCIFDVTEIDLSAFVENCDFIEYYS